MIGVLRACLAQVEPDLAFERLEAAADHLDPLSLRARSDLVADALLADLPDDYPGVARTFRAALADPTFTGWMIWPVTEAVTTLALSSPGPRDVEDGLALLSELTPRLTGEFAIRRFLAADLHRSLAVVRTWTADPDPHVRRLASEGTRPFLPWAVRVEAILAEPRSTVPILDDLRGDASDMVRRSVANHLNDLSRQQPDLVVEVAARWLQTPDESTAWVVRHGLRTLVKKAHPGALALLGFGAAQVAVSEPQLDTGTVTMPGDLGFAFDVTNEGTAPTRLAIDYAIHYLKSNGRHQEKVFKLVTRELAPGETVHVTKRHAFRPMTTRVHYPGLHVLELQVNGVRYTRSEFLVD